MSPRFVLGQENVPCVAEVVNRSLKADCTDFTSLLSTLMTYVKKMSDWPDPGGQIMVMTRNYSLLPHKGNFLEKLKTAKVHKYA